MRHLEIVSVIQAWAQWSIKIITAVAAIELSDDDIAAAKIAATTKPDQTSGQMLRNESGKSGSPSVKGKAVEAASGKPGSEKG